MRARLRLTQSAAGLLLLLLLIAEGAPGQERPAAETERGTQAQSGESKGTLEPGKEVEREIKGGAVHVYELSLAAGQFAHVSVDRRGLGIRLTMFGPDGKSLIQLNVGESSGGPEPMLLTAESSGTYRLEVQSLEHSASSGRYGVRVEELRAATERDRARVAGKAELDGLEQQFARLYGAGKYDEALPLTERAVAVGEEALGAEHPRVAMSLNNLAELYRLKSNYERAESLLQRALNISEKALAAGHPAIAESLNNLARLYRLRGNYERSETLFKRALEINEKALGAEHPRVATALNNLAGLYRAKGELARAEQLFLRALAIREKVLPPEHPRVAESLNNLAVIYRSRGDFVRAEALYQRAVELEERVLGKEHPDLAASTNNLAQLYMEKGDFARAEQLFLRALAIREKAFGPVHYEVAMSVSGLAIVYLRRGDLKRAESLFLRDLSIREQIYKGAHPAVALSLNNLAGLYNEGGQYERAEPFYRRSLEMGEKVLGAEHPELASAVNGLATVALARGDFERAGALFERALALNEKGLGPEHPRVASALHNLARFYAAKGDSAQAVASLARAADINERNLTLVLTTGSENQKRLYIDTLAGETDLAVTLHSRHAPNDPRALRLGLSTVLRRKGRVLDAVQDQIEALRGRLNPRERALLEQLYAARGQLATLVLRGRDKADPARHQAAVAKLEAEVERLEAAVSAGSTEFRARAQTVTLAHVQEALPHGAALVELMLYRPFNVKARSRAERSEAARYAAYVLRKDGEPLFADLGEAAVIDREVKQLRAALGNDQLTDIASVKRLARALHGRVMRPVRRLLGETRRVFLSPDGGLNLIPFGALVDERNRYLLETYTLTYLTSGRDLLRLQVQAQSEQPPVLVANPTFDEAAAEQSRPPQTADGARGRRAIDLSQERWEPLAYTADEVATIKELLPGARVLTTTQATEAALKQVSKPRILHVATHGFFLENKADDAPYENPLLRSGLILAGANRRQSGAGEDGVLTALEVAGLDLWGTDMVVLSACETGVGDVSNGEGVYGLRRALVLAGAESQVLTLWRVQDERTRDLMVGFYRRLQSGEGRTEALRNAQLAMLRGKRALGRHPFFWAGFIQSGGWQSVQAVQ
jgi:CHAT domain-containing protein/Tfp pilus assembly protein PilF